MNIDKGKIQLCMARKEMDRRELSECSGLAVPTIGTIMRRGRCSTKTVGKLARALGVDVEEIVEGRNDQ